MAAGETVYWKVRLRQGPGPAGRRRPSTRRRSRPTRWPTTTTAAWPASTTTSTSSARCASSSARRAAGIYADASARLEGSADAGAKTGTATGPRVLGFEQILASDYDKAKFPAPGEWYVSLNAADSALAPANVPAELPIEVDVQVHRPAPGVLGGLRALAARARRSSSRPRRRPARPGPAALFAGTDQPADPALTLALVAVIALLGGLALGALAIVVLGRRRT